MQIGVFDKDSFKWDDSLGSAALDLVPLEWCAACKVPYKENVAHDTLHVMVGRRGLPAGCSHWLGDGAAFARRRWLGHPAARIGAAHVGATRQRRRRGYLLCLLSAATPLAHQQAVAGGATVSTAA